MSCFNGFIPAREDARGVQDGGCICEYILLHYSTRPSVSLS